jgi:hypothetical protein
MTLFVPPPVCQSKNSLPVTMPSVADGHEVRLRRSYLAWTPAFAAVPSRGARLRGASLCTDQGPDADDVDRRLACVGEARHTNVCPLGDWPGACAGTPSTRHEWHVPPSPGSRPRRRWAGPARRRSPHRCLRSQEQAHTTSSFDASLARVIAECRLPGARRCAGALRATATTVAPRA